MSGKPGVIPMPFWRRAICFFIGHDKEASFGHWTYLDKSFEDGYEVTVRCRRCWITISGGPKFSGPCDGCNGTGFVYQDPEDWAQDVPCPSCQPPDKEAK